MTFRICTWQRHTPICFWVIKLTSLANEFYDIKCENLMRLLLSESIAVLFVNYDYRLGTFLDQVHSIIWQVLHWWTSVIDIWAICTTCGTRSWGQVILSNLIVVLEGHKLSTATTFPKYQHFPSQVVLDFPVTSLVAGTSNTQLQYYHFLNWWSESSIVFNPL